MARVKNFDQITGNIGKLSFYTRKGSSEIFVRRKGGASKEKIKRDPAFANLRKVNKEFGGSAKMSKQIRMAFYGLEHVAEYNLAPAFSKLAHDILKTDTENPTGERAISLSKFRYLLTGFDFSRSVRFNSLLRVPLSHSIDRNKQQAIVHIPSFACSFGLHVAETRGATYSKTPNASAYGHFRITAALGIVTDMLLNPANQTYEPVHDKLGQGFQTVSTPWYSTQTTVPEQDLTLCLQSENSDDNTQTDTFTNGTTAFKPNFTDADTLVLTVVLEFGTPDAFGNTMPVRGAGGGMIMGAI